MLRFCRSRTSCFRRSIRLLHFVFLIQRRLVRRLVGFLEGLDLDRELPIDIGDLTVDLDHGRIAGLVGLEFLLIIRHQCAALGAQSLDDGVGKELRQVDGARRVELPVQLFVFDPFGHQRVHGDIGAGEVGLGDGRLVVGLNDLLLFAEVEQHLFRLLQTQLQLRELVLQEDLGVGIGFEALVQIRSDERVGVGRRYTLRPRRIGIGVGDVDQSRADDRLYGAVAHDDARRRGLVVDFAAPLGAARPFERTRPRR